MYKQLLERVYRAPEGTCSNCKAGTVSDPFSTILQSVRDTDTIPPYMRDEYPEVVYWTKIEYLKDFQNGRGKLRTSRTTELGSAGFLENEFGVISSKDNQQKFRDSLRPLLYTLLHHNLAATTWLKCTNEAREYVLRSLRTRFSEFRMCADDWKADMFTSLNYSHWSDRPRDSTSETMVKEEEYIDSAPPANLSLANSRIQKRTESIGAPSVSSQLDTRKKTKPDAGVSELYDSQKENDIPVKVSYFYHTACRSLIYLQLAPVVSCPDKNPLDIFAQNAVSTSANPRPESQASRLKQFLIGKRSSTQTIANETTITALDLLPQPTPDVLSASSSSMPMPGSAPSASSSSMPVPEPHANTDAQGAQASNKRKRNPTDPNSIMRPSSTLSTPRYAFLLSVHHI